MEVLAPVLHFVETQGTLTIILQTAILLTIRSFIVKIPSRWHLEPGKKGDIQRAKYGESLWFFLYYTFSFSSGVAYLWDKEWLWDYRKYWLPNALDIPEFPVGLQLIYTMQTAFYIGASIVVLFLSHARANYKDSLIMLTHHFVTITLLAVSYAFGQHRIGSVVLILHDVSDIFLEGAKLCRYSGFEFITNYAFATFALVFFVSRLIIFPSRILYAIVTYFPRQISYVVEQCNYEGVCTKTSMFSLNVAGFWLFLLGTLQCLHIYWFYLIFRMILRAVSDKHIEKDIRSDDEADLNDMDSPKTKKRNGHKVKSD